MAQLKWDPYKTKKTLKKVRRKLTITSILIQIVRSIDDQKQNNGTIQHVSNGRKMVFFTVPKKPK